MKSTIADAPSSYRDLISALQRCFDMFTPSHRKVAQKVLSDPEACAFMTVSELAQAVGVNESTVVRFATGLGLNGYPALTALCREQLRVQAQLLRRFDVLESARNLTTPLLNQTVALEEANVARTFARINDIDWQRAIAALTDGRMVFVMGLRNVYAPAYLLGYLLQLVRDNVRTLSLGSGTLPDELRRLGPEDTFVGISFHRYARETIRALHYARRQGATTIALTDTAASPLARSADLTFYVDTAGVSFLRSVTGFISIAQALVADVALRIPSAREALSKQDALSEEFDLFESNGPREAASRANGAGPDETM